MGNVSKRRCRQYCALLLLFWWQPAVLEAQYPGASYRTAETPLLSQHDQKEPPRYNPAFLGLGHDPLRNDLFRNFHLRVLDIMISSKYLSDISLSPLPKLQNALLSRVDELVKGLSVPFSDLSSREQIYIDALDSYQNDIQNDLVPPLAAGANIGLSQDEIEQEPEYRRYRNRLEGDASTLLNNTGRVLGQTVGHYLNEQSALHGEGHASILDLEFLLADQLSLGFGVNIRSHIDIADDLSGFTVDVQRLDLPNMSLDGIALPPDGLWQNEPNVAAGNLEAALYLASVNYLARLSSSLSIDELTSLVLGSLFEQSFIDLFHVIEPNLRFSFGIPLSKWLYLGSRLQTQLLWGVDNLMVGRAVLDKIGYTRLFEYIYNPANYRLSFHTGWDLSLLIQLADWFNFSLMVTDVLGIAPGRANATPNYWGDFYYPIDVHLGVYFEFPLSPDLRLGLGADVYELVSLIAQRRQRFSIVEGFEFVDYFRAKLYFEYENQFSVALHYWNQAIGLSFQLDFLAIHPSVGVELDFDLNDVRIRLNILHFTNR